MTLGVSQDTMARELGYSPSTYWRLEADPSDEVGLVRLSEIASILGLELSIGQHDVGDPVRDKGQQALGKRFDALPSSAWRLTSETLLPTPGDRRSWDRLLRLLRDGGQLVGTELETRIRDVQALVRRTRLRERDGGVDVILIVLSDSAHNRSLVDELRLALGPAYATPPRAILAALRAGRPLPGSGVILI
jgi:hypothetical protein